MNRIYDIQNKIYINKISIEKSSFKKCRVLKEFVRTDKKAAIVRQTRYYKYSDPWHYTSEGYIDLGERFALQLNELLNK